ncbi:MAG: glycosyltransferase family 2 protein [Microgenomates group bacterium]
MNKIQLSVIVPFYNEEENLATLHSEVTDVLKKLKISSEIVYVDDGSTDRSREVLGKAIEKKDKIATKLITLRRNFGQTAAMSAGVDKANGDLVSFLDADLQNDPKDIPRFLEKIKEGYDAVFGWRKERKDKTARSFLSRMANLVIQKLFNYPFHDVGCSARMVKKEYLEGINLYGELHRILSVLIFFKGPRVSEIIVNHRQRYKGKSKYGYDRIIKTIIDLITIKFLNSYGTKPAYVFGAFGLGNLLLGGITLLMVAYRKIFLGVFVHKDPFFLITIFLILLGTQFILMGLFAELQVRTYFESQNKQIYEIKNEINY